MDIDGLTQERVVGAIYGAIPEPDRWRDVVHRIGDWLGADCGLMMTPQLPGISAVPLFAYGLDITPILAAYPRHAGRAEYTHRALATGRCPGAFLVSELMPPEEQVQNPFWRDVVEPTGLTSGIFGLLRGPEEGLKPVIINYYRKLTRAPFETADAARLESLFPHLRRALAVSLDAPPRRDVTASAAAPYDAIGAPSFLLGASGVVIHANHAAGIMLTGSDDISVRQNRLILQDRAAQTQLDDAIARTCKRGWSSFYRVGAEILVQRPTGGAIVLIVTPLGTEGPIAATAAIARCAVMVLEERLRTNGHLPERLRRLYGLTEAETEIAIELAGGRTLTDIAVQRGTSIGTVRTQLKAAMSKTGTTRQGDLSSLVSRLRF